MYDTNRYYMYGTPKGVDEVLSEAWWVKVLLVCDRGRRSTLDDYHGHPAASHPTPSGPSADHHAAAQSGRFQEKAIVGYRLAWKSYGLFSRT
ncbi:hypothetical protein Pmani_028170 [Petrolisthes manimaculis]|uniref:Uncharacterized protein n=1 Tax=Petrolisthes manimaculis TaxID=1843537 RepID=A0AAE1P194_9EUCA|nr:hypothetical protein Pmani_028170 [Petrolisthes manimaculis]